MQYVVWQSCEKHKCLESGPREHSIVSCPLSGHRRLLETNSPGRRLASVRAYLLVFFLEVLVLLVAGTVDVGSRISSYYIVCTLHHLEPQVHQALGLRGCVREEFSDVSATCHRSNERPAQGEISTYFTRIRMNMARTPNLQQDRVVFP